MKISNYGIGVQKLILLENGLYREIFENKNGDIFKGIPQKWEFTDNEHRPPTIYLHSMKFYTDGFHFIDDPTLSNKIKLLVINGSNNFLGFNPYYLLCYENSDLGLCFLKAQSCQTINP